MIKAINPSSVRHRRFLVLIGAICTLLLLASTESQVASSYARSRKTGSWGSEAVANALKGKCTLMLLTYDRGNLLSQLEHYQNWAFLDRILVVWNHQTLNPNFTVSQDLLPDDAHNDLADGSNPIRFKVVVRILQQPRNSLNNRFQPFPEIRTHCVISLDDDYLIPAASQQQLVDAFYNGNTDRIVGYEKMARTHAPVGDKMWEYRGDADVRGASIALPSGSVFHRKYLEMYTHALPVLARETVDMILNGEDILLNMMIANATGKPPLIVNATMGEDGAGEKGNATGLWLRPGHKEARSWALTAFTHLVFGRMPLVTNQS
ncbi:exostosin [Chytriomyces sp. MP71]|nr:exostosin [Chytriomyces sp. MP71]